MSHAFINTNFKKFKTGEPRRCYCGKHTAQKTSERGYDDFTKLKRLDGLAEMKVTQQETKCLVDSTTEI